MLLAVGGHLEREAELVEERAALDADARDDVRVGVQPVARTEAEAPVRPRRPVGDRQADLLPACNRRGWSRFERLTEVTRDSYRQSRGMRWKARPRNLLSREVRSTLRLVISLSCPPRANRDRQRLPRGRI